MKMRRTRRCFAELLEVRSLLCVDHAGTLPPDVQSLFGSDGHIPLSVAKTLSADVLSMIDPHSIADDRPIEEQFAGLGMPGTTTSPAGRASGDAAPALPDFYPGLDETPYISQTYQPGRTLLRFGTTVYNAGTGPGLLVGGAANSDGTQTVYQRVYDWSGTNFTTYTDHLAGRFIYHPQHSHLHFEGYARYRLLTNVNGSPGPVALRSDGTEAVGEKVGYCLIDIESSFTLPNGQSSRTLTGYNQSNFSTSCGQFQGINVGHADVYSSALEGQWIDVTGVTNGSYFLELSIDNENAMLESDETNNIKTFPVTLNVNPTTGGIQPDRFDLAANGGPNNTFQTATNLGVTSVSTVAGLTNHASYDDDFFKFVAASTGTGNIRMTSANGDVNLFLYGAQFNELRRSTSPALSGQENVSYNFVEGETYYVLTQAYNEARSSNYEIAFNIKPTVRTHVVTNASEDGLTAGQITIARNGQLTSALVVNYTVSGSATSGVDFEALAGSVTFDVESSVKTIDITPILDSIVEADETVTITLNTNSAYVVGPDATSATVVIADIPPRVTASRFDPLVNAVRFDFSLDVEASLDVTDLLITDVATGIATTVGVRTVEWDDAQKQAIFTLDGVLPLGNYRATLPTGSVTHAFGSALREDAVVAFRYTPADTDLDADVDFDDLLALAQNYGTTSGATLARGDVDYDGDVDFDDLLLLAQHYGTTAPAVTTAPAPKEKAAEKRKPSVRSEVL